jgi:large subunit ribosomal protein L31e
MSTSDVRIDTAVNQYVWNKGIKDIPTRVRVRLIRRRNEDEDAKEKMVTTVALVNVTDFHKLETKNVKDN